MLVDKKNVVFCSAQPSYMCSLVLYINISLVQERSAGRHTGDPQESSKHEALRHGHHVHVFPGEERWGLFDQLLQATHTFIVASSPGHFYQSLLYYFSLPQCLKNCSTSSTKLILKDHPSQPYRRSTACDPWIKLCKFNRL